MAFARGLDNTKNLGPAAATWKIRRNSERFRLEARTGCAGHGTMEEREVAMRSAPTRRDLIAGSSSIAAASILSSASAIAQEAPPETTGIRLLRIPGVCTAPQYVADELLKVEGFNDIQHVEIATNDSYTAFAARKFDITMAFVAPFIIQVDAGLPIVLLGGVHVGCFEVFATERIRSIRDLKGKTVAVPGLASPHYVFFASMAAHVGVDAKRDINFVFQPVPEAMQLLADGKIDGLIGFPPDAQELREKKIGHVIINSGLDRPWSQYFCCIFAAHKDFVGKHPVATKRALRAILKAANFCAAEPERAARLVADRGYRYDYALQTMREISYAKWQQYDAEDTIRFYSLRLREAGMLQSQPQKIIAQGTDWRFFNELKRELKT
jgi:NitT/TauT family transport system substrate-binding protein